MTAELKPYPGYQSSGTECLGVFPSHWRIQRAKTLLREVDERSQAGDEELLSVSHKTGVTPRRTKNVSMFLAESNAGHKICRPGDVVVNTMWAWMAAVGVSRLSGLVSPSYGVYRPQTSLLKSGYLDALLRTPNYRNEFLVHSTGITSSRLRLYPDEFLRIPLPIPPDDEQDAIVRFLNYQDLRIRQYVIAKQKLVNLLGERRMALADAAVQSDGIHDVRIAAIANKVERPVDRKDDQLYTPIGMYNKGRGIFHKTSTKGADLGDSTFFWIRDDDLILSGQFAWEGAVALASARDEGCIASHRYPILRGKPGSAESAYVLSFLQTAWGQLLLDHHSRGAAGRNRPLNLTSLMKEKLPVPNIDEQRKIANLVRHEFLIRESMAGLMKFLSEYRTRLVADVVTGQLDVREAAAGLPDEIGEPYDLPLDPLVEDHDEEETVSEELGEETFE